MNTKISRRKKHSIVINFLFTLFLLTSAILTIILYILPELEKITLKTTQTKATIVEINQINQNWLSKKAFIDLILSNKLNDLTLEDNYEVALKIVKWMNKTSVKKAEWEDINSNKNDFYISNFTNNSDTKNYDEFLTEKEEAINNEDSIDSIIENDNKVSVILPLYTTTSVLLWDQNHYLTTFKFVNYIESILETFKLKSNNKIGINWTNIIKEYAYWKWNNQWLISDANIYWIPLDLQLSWTKENILKFLYFINNVGVIIDDDKDILINKKYGILEKNNIKTILSWDKYSQDYNIFRHQMLDIKHITFDDYIDSSSKIRTDQEFVDFIIKKQGRHREYKISVELEIYVRWAPILELEKYINNVFKNFRKLTSKVTLWLSNPNTNSSEYIKLKRDSVILDKYKKEIKGLMKHMKDKSKIEEVFHRASDMNIQILKISDRLNLNK